MVRSLLTIFLLAGGAALAASPAAPPTSPAMAAPTREVATFAGGCFWSMQKAFEDVPGIVSTEAGYAGGTTVNPTYEEVETGSTGHAESVQIVFDPSQVTYAQLLDRYWHHIDPLTKDRQICDAGHQYRTAIFVHGPQQRALAEASKKALEASGRFHAPIATEIVPATPFYPAEAYHQHFAKEHPIRYGEYRIGCGRDRALKAVWGDEAPTH